MFDLSYRKSLQPTFRELATAEAAGMSSSVPKAFAENLRRGHGLLRVDGTWKGPRVK